MTEETAFSAARDLEEALAKVVDECSTEAAADPDDVVDRALAECLGEELDIRRTLWILAGVGRLEFTDDMRVRST